MWPGASLSEVDTLDSANTRLSARFGFRYRQPSHSDSLLLSYDKPSYAKSKVLAMYTSRVFYSDS